MSQTLLDLYSDLLAMCRIGLYEMTETASFSSPWITTFCGGVDQSSHISDTHFMRTMATECHHNPNEVISMRLPLDSNLKLSISFTDGEILWESRYFPVVLTGWVWRRSGSVFAPTRHSDGCTRGVCFPVGDPDPRGYAREPVRGKRTSNSVREGGRYCTTTSTGPWQPAPPLI